MSAALAVLCMLLLAPLPAMAMPGSQHPCLGQGVTHDSAGATASVLLQGEIHGAADSHSLLADGDCCSFSCASALPVGSANEALIHRLDSRRIYPAAQKGNLGRSPTPGDHPPKALLSN